MTKRPRAPKRPGEIKRYPGEGTVFVAETFPSDQKDRELLFARRFAGGLAHFNGHIITNLRVNDEEFPDILAEEKETTIGLEVTEVHDLGRAYYVAEKEYVAALAERLPDIASSANQGGIFSLALHGRPSRQNAQKGQQLLGAMERTVRALLPFYRGLGDNQVWRNAYMDHQTSLEFDVMLWRQGGTGIQLDIAFRPPFNAELARTILAAPITEKLRHYGTLKMPTLLLVVDWSRHMVGVTEVAFQEAHSVVASAARGVFREVWFVAPMVASEPGLELANVGAGMGRLRPATRTQIEEAIPLSMR